MGGVVPYGYRAVKGADGLSRFEVDPDEAEVVRAVFKLVLTESIGLKRVARRLGELGYKPRMGANSWGPTTINRMMKSRIYTGILSYGRHKEHLDRRTGKVRKVLLPRDQHLIHRDEKLRIVSDADFEAVQKRLKGFNYRNYSIPGEVRIFSGIVTCGCCGYGMYSRHNNRKNAKRWLACGLRDRLGKDACSNAQHPKEEELLAWVQAGIRKVIRNRDQIIRRAVEIADKSLSSNGQRRGKLESDLSKLDQALARFQKLLRDPTLDEEQMRGLLSQIGAVESEKTQLNARIREVADEAVVDQKAVLREIKAALNAAEENILTLATPPVMNRAIQQFCGQMVIHADGAIEPARIDGEPRAPPLTTVTPTPARLEPNRSACSRP